MKIFKGKTSSVEFKTKWEKPFPWYKKINPIWWFTNEDDAIVPAEYATGENEWIRQIKWNIRNPLHNFTFYVIGIGDYNHVRTGNAPDKVFDIDLGWTWAVCKLGWLRLPFISYIGKLKFYIGWRDGGNWGIKLTTNRDNG